MLLGLQSMDQNNQLYEVILVSAHQLSLALVVPNILGTVHLSDQQIEHDIFSTPTALKPYIKGYSHGNAKEGIAYLLKAENILRSTILHS
jgi:twitching motility protein PilI